MQYTKLKTDRKGSCWCVLKDIPESVVEVVDEMVVVVVVENAPQGAVVVVVVVEEEEVVELWIPQPTTLVLLVMRVELVLLMPSAFWGAGGTAGFSCTVPVLAMRGIVEEVVVVEGGGGRAGG